MIKKAIALHIEVSHEYGDPIPPPEMSVEQALETTVHSPTTAAGTFPPLNRTKTTNLPPFWRWRWI